MITPLAIDSGLGRSGRSGRWIVAPPESPSEDRRKGTLVYAVDDMRPILDLYVLLLASVGCPVTAFHNRAVALAALATERRKPDLLITDYCGGGIPIGQFLRQSAALHPRLLILMVSGLHDPGWRTGSVRPDLFLQKPFTNDEFKRAVETALRIRGSHPPGQPDALPEDEARTQASDNAELKSF